MHGHILPARVAEPVTGPSATVAFLRQRAALEHLERGAQFGKVVLKV